jgi:hypothetical protein
MRIVRPDGLLAGEHTTFPVVLAHGTNQDFQCALCKRTQRAGNTFHVAIFHWKEEPHNWPEGARYCQLCSVAMGMVRHDPDRSWVPA